MGGGWLSVGDVLGAADVGGGCTRSAGIMPSLWHRQRQLQQIPELGFPPELHGTLAGWG